MLMTRAFAVNVVVWWRGSEEQRGVAMVSRVFLRRDSRPAHGIATKEL